MLQAWNSVRYPPSLFKTLQGEYSLEKKESVLFGIMHETAAINCYQMKTGQQVRKSGLTLFINGFLGGSPDGFVGDGGLL